MGIWCILSILCKLTPCHHSILQGSRFYRLSFSLHFKASMLLFCNSEGKAFVLKEYLRLPILMKYGVMLKKDKGL